MGVWVGVGVIVVGGELVDGLHVLDEELELSRRELRVVGEGASAECDAEAHCSVGSARSAAVTSRPRKKARKPLPTAF